MMQAANILRVPVYVPLCRETPEFSKDVRLQIPVSPHGSAARNTIVASVRIRIRRVYP